MSLSHSHTHSHHDHSLPNSNSKNKKYLLICFILIFSYMFIEFFGGLYSNSLALLSDAGHMLSDAAALGFSLVAFKISEIAANQQKTYGYRRFEIIAAFFNGFTLIVIAVLIFYEAYFRFFEPPQVMAPSMLLIAVFGLFINIFTAWLLTRGDTKNNLNMRSAYLHVLADLLGSVGAIIAALLIIFFNWQIADPIVSVIVAGLILQSGLRVLLNSVHILSEGKPQHIDLSVIKDSILKMTGVIAVNDLHIWTITSNYIVFTSHLQVNDAVQRDSILHEIEKYLHNNYQISHSTIQIEKQFSHEHCN